MVKNMNIRIDQKIKDKMPELRLGILICDVVVEESSSFLMADMKASFDALRAQMTTSDISKLINIQKARAGYRALGKDPTKYRVSSEKLLRRVLKGQGIDAINNIVDLSNLISVTSQNSVGTYDLDLIKGPVVFDSGETGTSYLNIGGQDMNLENLPILRDANGPFGSTTADSKATAVTGKTKRILMNIISFNLDDDLEGHMASAERLLRQYGSSQMIEKHIIS